VNKVDNIQFAKNIKVIDWLKTEILGQTSNLFKSLQYANQHLVLDSLSSLVALSYVMSCRMGFTYKDLDQAVIQKLKDLIREGHQLEEWYGDLSKLDEYLSKRL